MLVGTDVCVPVVFVWEETGILNIVTFYRIIYCETFIN